MVLLDTCVLLWLASEQSALTERVKKILLDHAGNLYISSITAFEIAIKVKKVKMELPLPTAEWIQEALRLHGIEEIPINAEIAVASASLPNIHNDPCDRIIIATARVHNMVVVTPDKTIPQYPGIETVWE